MRRRGESAACGLCGLNRVLSRTHVPPQCAGNNHGVQRRYLQTTDRAGMPTLIQSTKRFDGGLYVYGLCQPCNSRAARWDKSYCDLATALRKCWSSGALVVPGNRLQVPSAQCSPSAVVRSVLMGLFGVNHRLRDSFPDLAAGLLAAKDGLTLPPDLVLRVALARGTSGRLTGVMHSREVLGLTGAPHVLTLMSDAAVYFPPLAWQLTRPGSTLLDWQGWADASPWLPIPVADRRDIRDLVPSLPLVLEPSQDPAIAEGLVHLLTDEVTPIVECYGLVLE